MEPVFEQALSFTVSSRGYGGGAWCFQRVQYLFLRNRNRFVRLSLCLAGCPSRYTFTVCEKLLIRLSTGPVIHLTGDG